MAVQEIRFSDIPLLSGLDKINLARLIPNFEQLHAESGEVVLRHGEPWDAVYIIVEGIVRVFLPAVGSAKEIACLGPGDCFGEMALLTGEPGSADIDAMTDLSLLRLSKLAGMGTKGRQSLEKRENPTLIPQYLFF